MKTIINFSLSLLLFTILISSCERAHTKEIANASNVDIINDQFPESKKEIKAVLDGIFKSLQEKDADKLISYHIYGPKFTEFKGTARRFNSEENEAYERELVGAISGFDYDLGDLAINVFGDVAVVSFHADFRPTINGDVVQIWELTTLVFVKVNGDWKITHEHHSPLDVE